MIEKMYGVIENLEPKLNKIDFSNEFLYSVWLSQAYYIARRSTDFLGLCMFQTNDLIFKKRCMAHISEESGHELIILKDLENLNFPLFEELPETSLIYQPQHYRIIENPISFLGYVFYLEMLAPKFGPKVIAQVKNKKSVNFLKVHSHDDEDHLQKAISLFNSLDEKTRKLIFSNFEMTNVAYTTMIEKIASMAESNRAAA